MRWINNMRQAPRNRYSVYTRHTASDTYGFWGASPYDGNFGLYECLYQDVKEHSVYFYP